MNRMLLDNLMIVPMNENKVIEKGYIIVEDNLIKEVGEGKAPEADFDRIIDGTGKVALPGFINTHTHAAMTLLRGYADDLPLMEWLQSKIWPLEAQLDDDDIYWGTKLAILEMIKSGTTCFTDMYMFEDRVAEAVEETGIRAVLSRGMVGVGPEHERAITESRDWVKKYHDTANGRIKFMLGPHAPYTCPPDYLKKVIDLADELGVGIHIHLSETKGEVEDITAQYGKSPVAHLESLGVFDRQVLAAHCVHLNDEDIQILKKYDVGVAHNPESNMKLGSGIAPVTEMLAAGIAVGLGTDGTSSNNDLDMLQEMRTASLLQKVKGLNPTVLPAYQALEMATVNGAKALHLEKEVGQLLSGKKADIILMSLEEAHMVPVYDVIANIVYSAKSSDVQTVIIDGKIIMENRVVTSFDETEVVEKVKEKTARFK